MPRLSGFNRPSPEGLLKVERRGTSRYVFGCLGVQVFRGWMKMVWDESVIGRNRFWTKVFLDESVSVFG